MKLITLTELLSLIYSQKIKSDLALKDAELNELQQATHTEKIKSSRLELLIQKCLSSNSISFTESSNPISTLSTNPSMNKPLIAAVSAVVSPGKNIPNSSKRSFRTTSNGKH